MYQGLDFEQFAKEVHQNAVEHGWWDPFMRSWL